MVPGLAMAQGQPGGNSYIPGNGSGGAVSSVTGAGTVTCTPTTGSVVCTGSGSGGGISALTGDVTASGTGSVPATAVGLNGTLLSGLGTGILKNTTATGVPSIAAAGDFPTLNQNTTGSAASLSALLAVASGGTYLASGTSGGILGYTATGVLASSVLLTTHAIVLGAGAGATPTVLASLGTSTTVLHGAAAGAPTFGAVALTTDVSGTLPIANGGLANTADAIIGGGTKFTQTPTGCTPSATTGTAAGGTITLASGPCTSIVITINGATGLSATTGWGCSVTDLTTELAGTYIPVWSEKSSTLTTATIPIPAAVGATDVIRFTCQGY